MHIAANFNSELGCEATLQIRIHINPDRFGINIEKQRKWQ